MATQRWRGDAAAVAQVNTITPASVTVGNIFTVTINGKSVSFTATAATVANVTAGLSAACNASTYPEFTEITFTDATTKINATADTAGKPFTQTSSAAQGTGSAGMSLTTATATASAGPNDWSTAANWSSGSVPVSTDDVFIQNSAVSIKYGLDQSAVTLASLTIDASFTGYVGLLRTNIDNSAGSYIEYRDTYLKVSATTITIGRGTGTGSGLLRLNTGTAQTTGQVLLTGTSVETDLPALCWIGTHASGAWTISKGTMGIAVQAGEVATVATLRVGYISNVSSDATVRCGSGTTLTTITKNGGSLTIASNSTTVTQDDGTLTVLGGTVTTLNVNGGTVYYQGTGTLTTASVRSGGVLDFGTDIRARTVTNCYSYYGSSVKDPNKTVTWTNGIEVRGCALSNVSHNVGKDVKITPVTL